MKPRKRFKYTSRACPNCKRITAFANTSCMVCEYQIPNDKMKGGRGNKGKVQGS